MSIVHTEHALVLKLHKHYALNTRRWLWRNILAFAWALAFLTQSSSLLVTDAERAAGCPRISLSSDTIFLETVSESTGEGFSPVGLPPRPHIRIACQSQLQVVISAPEQTTVNQSEPLKLPSLGLVNLLEWFSELREMPTQVTRSLKAICTDEEIHRVRSGRDPWTWGNTPGVGVCLPGSSLNPVTLRF